MKSYGKELILDLHNCDPGTFTRENISLFFKELCKHIDMEMQDCHFWDDEGLPLEECQTEPHLKGTSAIQFITTSNITIHTLDLLKAVYINVFSCKDFKSSTVKIIAKAWFKGDIVNAVTVTRL